MLRPADCGVGHTDGANDRRSQDAEPDCNPDGDAGTEVFRGRKPEDVKIQAAERGKAASAHQGEKTGSNVGAAQQKIRASAPGKIDNVQAPDRDPPRNGRRPGGDQEQGKLPGSRGLGRNLVDAFGPEDN